MTSPRVEVDTNAGERGMLEGWLEYHRATLAIKCADLSPEQLRRHSVPTTTLTLLGIVRHMADVERHWFQNIFAGSDEPPTFFTDENLNGDFDDLESMEPDETFETWETQCARSREIAADASLDDIGKKRDRRNADFSMRWIIVHMIEEYARHNGHADLIREAIDGATGE